MRIGDFRERVEVYVDVPEKLPNGDITGQRSHVVTLWARVEVLKGTRALNAGQILNGQPYEVEVRNPAPVQITADMLLEWRDQTITIHSVAPVDLKRNTLLITGATVK